MLLQIQKDYDFVAKHYMCPAVSCCCPCRNIALHATMNPAPRAADECPASPIVAPQDKVAAAAPAAPTTQSVAIAMDVSGASLHCCGKQAGAGCMSAGLPLLLAAACIG